MSERRDDETGAEHELNYATEMGGGAPDTGLAGKYNPRAHVRDVYDRTADEPGTFDEGERPDGDEPLS